MTIPSSFDSYSRRLCAVIKRGGTLADSEFGALAGGLFALQFASVAPYRRLCEARGITPATLADWLHIPAVPTAAFKDLELTSLACADRPIVFHSSGTTEHRPSRHFHNTDSLAIYEASLLPWFERHLLPGEGRSRPRLMLCLAPPPEQAPHSSLVHMFASVSAAFGDGRAGFLARLGVDNAWILDGESAVTALRDAECTGEPVVLLGTAFMFVHLLDDLERRGLKLALPPGSRVMETGGYKGRARELPKAELHALIAERLGVPGEFIVCEYGMSELSSQAYDRSAGNATGHRCAMPDGRRAFHFPPWCRSLVISPETGREVEEGETGMLRMCDLANVRSVMAIQTEDLAVRRGAGFELLGRAARTEARGCSLMAA